MIPLQRPLSRPQTSRFLSATYPPSGRDFPSPSALPVSGSLPGTLPRSFITWLLRWKLSPCGQSETVEQSLNLSRPPFAPLTFCVAEICLTSSLRLFWGEKEVTGGQCEEQDILGNVHWEFLTWLYKSFLSFRSLFPSFKQLPESQAHCQ